MKIYVASSWRNPEYPAVVAALRRAGHEVYDFRAANRAFNWAQIDPTWDPANPVLSCQGLHRALASPEAEKAFDHDKAALDWADAGVLVMPCGRSAHLEAGYLRGRGRPVHVLLADQERPDLMHKLAQIHTSLPSILAKLRDEDPALRNARDRVETYEGLVAKWTAHVEGHRRAGRAIMESAGREALANCQAALIQARADLDRNEARLRPVPELAPLEPSPPPRGGGR